MWYCKTCDETFPEPHTHNARTNKFLCVCMSPLVEVSEKEDEMKYYVIWYSAGERRKSIPFPKAYALEQAERLRFEFVDAHVEDENGNIITS